MIRPLRLLIIACALSINSHASTVSTFDVLVATGNLTVSATAAIYGDVFGVWPSTFIIDHGYVGVGTAAPDGYLHIVIPDQENKVEFLVRKGNFNTGFRFGKREFGSWDQIYWGELAAAIGGVGNLTRGDFSAVMGGSYNWVFGAGGFIGGGGTNTIEISSAAGAQNAAILGGALGLVGHEGVAAIVAGGFNNAAGRRHSAVIAGENNIAIGTRAIVLAGESNLASGESSVVLGGVGNISSGSHSFAAGSFANATGNGSFVWADSQISEFKSSIDDEFKIRARGGFVFYSTATAPTVILSSGSILISTAAAAVTAVPNIYISSSNGRVGIGTSSPAATLDVNGAARIGSTLTVSAFGIQWGDGSFSTTAFSGSSASCGGAAWCVISSSNPASTSSVTFSVPASSITYELTLDASWQNSDGFVEFYFNNDTGSRYYWGGTVGQSNGGEGPFSGTQPDSKCRCQLSTAVGAGNPVKATLQFGTDQGNSNNALGRCIMTFKRGSGVYERDDGVCAYEGTSPIVSVSVKASAGAFKGRARLVQRGD